jgi:hypothetical protein
MKKRDLFIVLVVLAFGLIYNYVESGEIRFYDGCSFDNRGLIDRNHPNSFKREELSYFGPGIGEIEIDNKAGGIEVMKTDGKDIRITPEVRVYHRDKERAAEIEQEIRIKVRGEGSGKLGITLEPEDRFPYNRVRVFFKVSIPDSVELDLWNRYGDVTINGSGKKVTVDNKHGDVTVKHVDAALKTRHKHGNVVIRDVKGDVNLSSHHSRISVTDVGGLKLNTSHARVYINGVKNETDVEYAAHCSFEMENGSGLTIAGRYTKMKIKRIEKGVKIANSHQSIYLEDINGDVNIKGRHCRIQMEKIIAGNVVVRNSYNYVGIDDLAAKNLDVLLSHGNLDVDCRLIEERINIKNKHSRIRISFPESVTPMLNAELKYGKLRNETPASYTILKERSRVRISSIEGTPQVIINNRYGDVYLKSNSFEPLSKLEDILPTRKIEKVETEEFKKLDEDKDK